MLYVIESDDASEPVRVIVNFAVSPDSLADESVAARRTTGIGLVPGLISMNEILLLLEPVALEMVSRPSATVTVLVPSTQRLEVVGVPSTVRTPSTLILKMLST